MVFVCMLPKVAREARATVGLQPKRRWRSKQSLGINTWRPKETARGPMRALTPKLGSPCCQNRIRNFSAAASLEAFWNSIRRSLNPKHISHSTQVCAREAIDEIRPGTKVDGGAIPGRECTV